MWMVAGQKPSVTVGGIDRNEEREARRGKLNQYTSTRPGPRARSNPG